ncbi:MAG: phytanoyl-CoA dioxygenase family protein [Rhizomicrobium sp.]
MSASLDRAASRRPEPTGSFAQLRRDIAECGYGILLGALDADLLARLKQRVAEQAAAEREAGVAYYFGDDLTGMPATRGGPDPAPNQRLSNLLNKGRVFRELLHHPAIAEVVLPMMGGRTLLSSLSAMIMKRGGVAQVLHSDQQFVPFRTPLPMVGNVVWMLVDFTRDNGATRVVPGSHLWEPPSIRIEKDAAGVANLVQSEVEPVIAEAPAGSALIFDGRLWHGAGANRTDVPRPALFSYYCQPYIRQQENIALSLLDDVYAEMSTAERAMVGFEAHNRGLGRIAPALGRVNTNWIDPAVGELPRPCGSGATPL